MRFSQVFGSILILALAASAAEIKIKVVDPQSAAVNGAQITLWRPGVLARQNGGAPLAIVNTSAEGLAVFHNVAQGAYRAQILAPGFAVQTVDISSSSELTTVQLKLAPAAETVVVTATRTPVPGETSGSQVESLSGQELETMQPVAANDTLRFLPGAVVNTAGQRGGLASLFVRGGDSTYNKVIVDGVTINEPGGTFDFGTLPLTEADHMEFLRGTQSTLYGSDAMTSVVQVWTRNGSTPIPELRFGADGGNFGTANGYASLAGARGRVDYNLFGDQFNTQGEGVNNAYSNSLQGANVGVAFTDQVSLRARFRHSNSFTGLPGEWNFNGDALLPPDPNEWKQLNNLLGSTELTITQPSGWQHRFSGFDYNYRYQDVNLTGDAARVDDFPTHASDHINRAGFEYQGDYLQQSWGHTTFGYRFEDENGVIGDLDYPPSVHGVRLNDDIYGQQQITWKRLSAVAGARFIHNGAFGNTGVPRLALTFLALQGGRILSGTRLRFSYAEGFKEPRLEETFAGPPYSVPNPTLKPERTRAFETGFQQSLFQGRYSLAATYFNNLFHDRIDYATNPVTFIGQYVNVDKSFAQGAEVEFQGQIRSRLSFNSAYTYTSTQILAAPVCTPANFCDPTTLGVGRPLLRRPKHSATLLLSYLGTRWGGNLRGSFVGPRADSDFLGFGINHAPGYVRADMGGWYVLNSRMTAYVNIENVLDRHYNEVVGYPALGTNFRAGMRFRIGGE
ncbi:MAG TPA: TonB-dependent receptor [Terriglobales bacterium]|nr:TonB-dependent receptor [Terriglobales bacterium]